jgi:molybdopterin-guanine dinucleotide biosynthesis protein A
MQRGAIILCGGKSSRMGRDKASLPFGKEAMLQRVVRLLSDVVPPRDMVVVAAADQSLPEIAAGVAVVRDTRPHRGPLEGLAAGLREIGDRVDAAYATACDVPLLAPAFVAAMFDALGEADVAVPRDGQYHHPLAAAYRPAVLPNVESLLAADRLRPVYLFGKVKTNEIDVEQLRTVDPELLTLRNLNSPEDYAQALAIAGMHSASND